MSAIQQMMLAQKISAGGGGVMSLASSGIATNLIFILAVDETGSNVKEFVSTTVDGTKVVAGGSGYGSGAGQVTLGSSTWKGTSRGWFQTKDNGGTLVSITFATNLPSVTNDATDGWSFYGVSAGTAYSGVTPPPMIAFDSDNRLGVDTSGHVCIYLGGAERHVGTTVLPTDGTTKYSFGANFRSNSSATGNAQAFYGAESGSLASDSTAANPGLNGSASYTVASTSGVSGSSARFTGKWHLICMFNKQLSLAEYQSLHDDWFGTLFVVS